jgi:hypothetical protein
MNKRTRLMQLAALVIGLSSPLLASEPSMNTRISGDVLVGYSGGAGMQLGATMSGFASGFPLAARLSLGWSKLDPGNATAVRHIFINDNENGTPQKNGYILDARFELRTPVHLFGPGPASLFFGPRYSRFKGHFDYVGGNEDFDIIAKQWGIGVGLQKEFPMNRRVSLSFTGGADYFFSSSLYGHDTTYSPDGENINAHEGYSYGDADKAVNQPKLKFLFLAGINYNF